LLLSSRDASPPFPFAAAASLSELARRMFENPAIHARSPLAFRY
jgi:hypothetical protein